MEHKVGDEVLVKGKITGIGGISVRYYDVEFQGYSASVSENEIIDSKTYAQGLTDAWELAKKVSMLLPKEKCEIFKIEDAYVSDILCDNTYEEALAKIEAYEKENEIKVGDIVTVNSIDGIAVVTNVGEGSVNVMWGDGIAGNCETSRLKKTGKNIDIESLLKQIGE